ncbi:DUF4340 domain-containing protein [bacterium]|nr:DUF4340 domain-containing protein [bacterium]NBX81770.1 DUF4340 domain-containing protein [bacterium]
MKIKVSSTSALVLGLAALSTWYALYEKKYRVDQANLEKEAKNLVSISKDNIQELEITHSSGEKFALKKTGTTWSLNSPLQDQADEGTLNSLLSTLTSAQEERTIEENPADLDVYGLKQPAVTLRITQDVNRTEDLFLGNPTQVGSSVYVKTSKKPAVVKTNKSLLSALQKSAFELRNKKLVPIPVDAAQEIEIQNSTGHYILKFSEKKQWLLARDGSPVNSQAWSKTLNALLDAKATAVVSEQADSKKYGLDRPQVKVWISTGAEGVRHQVWFSQVASRTFAKREDKPFIYEINSGLLKELSQSAEAFRDTHIVSFNRFAVQKIKIKKGEVVTEFVKDGAAWKLANGKPEEKVDASKVEAMLTQIQDAQLKQWVSSGTPGFSPQLSVEIFENQNNQEVLSAQFDLAAPQGNELLGKSSWHKLAWKVGVQALNLVTTDKTSFFEKS